MREPEDLEDRCARYFARTLWVVIGLVFVAGVARILSMAW